VYISALTDNVKEVLFLCYKKKTHCGCDSEKFVSFIFVLVRVTEVSFTLILT